MDFILGCNYWASNAGTEMWTNWDENAVRKDIKTLSEYGVKYLRVFPNWKYFQPATGLYRSYSKAYEICHVNGSYFNNEYYLDEILMERFGIFCDICEEYGVKLIVALITGWMSGRLFVPPILEERNVFTDPLALRLELKLVKGFVSQFKNRSCIYAWGLGNECNCMSECSNDTASVWTGMISNAIRVEDSERPVISDMHGIGVDGAWQIKDQAEYCDILTTHPYPHFVPHCRKDGMLEFRTLMHSSCENKYYSDIGGKPCFPEEVGTLGPMTCDDKTATLFLKATAYQAWLNGCPGFMWWCANEQSHLNTAPYTWIMMERELGLLDSDGKPKEQLCVMKEIDERIASFGFKPLAPKEDIVCITTIGQDNWGISYMSYALARSQNLQLKFAYAKDKIPEGEFYMLPSISNYMVMSKDKYFELKKRVYEGATLYMSIDDGYVTEFSDFCGVTVADSKVFDEKCEVVIDGETINLERSCRREIYPSGAEVLAYDNLGIPALTKHKYGKGTVYFLNFPIEKNLLSKVDAFSGNYGKLYSLVFKDIIDNQPVKIDNPNVKITFYDDKAVLFNYSGEVQNVRISDKNNKFIREEKCNPYDVCVIDL